MTTQTQTETRLITCTRCRSTGKLRAKFLAATFFGAGNKRTHCEVCKCETWHYVGQVVSN